MRTTRKGKAKKARPANGGAGNGHDDEALYGEKLEGKDLLDALKGDACRILSQLVPGVIGAVEATSGSEKATITIIAAFNPGGDRSKSRFDVTGKATIPAGGTTHQAVLESGQLHMFELAQPIA